jgi:hypothetical protein
MSLRLYFSVLLACLGAVVARAQVTFTFSGTVLTSTLGYTEGCAATFTVTTGATFDQASSSFVEGNYWYDEYFNQPALFIGLSGTGLSSNFSRPGNLTETGLGDPRSYLETGSDQKTLSILIGNGKVPNFDNYGLGLTLPSGPTIGSFAAYIDVPNVLDIENGPFPQLSCYSDPVTYFSALAGSYEGICTGTVTIFDTSYNPFAEVPDPSHLVAFEISSMTISAIPEPSTYAAIFGAAAVGVVGVRRLGRKKLKP